MTDIFDVNETPTSPTPSQRDKALKEFEAEQERQRLAKLAAEQKALEDREKHAFDMAERAKQKMEQAERDRAKEKERRASVQEDERTKQLEAQKERMKQFELDKKKQTEADAARAAEEAKRKVRDIAHCLALEKHAYISRCQTVSLGPCSLLDC